MEHVNYSPHNLIKYRTKAGLSQSACARKAKVSLRFLILCEKDESSPGEFIMARLGKACGVVFAATRTKRSNRKAKSE